ncbi:hypothetical protein N0B51_08635 [Tsuneonella sp. YG55]|uniref:Uncharacterized protein n=1 Tax=Tsuneonella litorea TaxID=2976475 RepID=A0A9X2W3F5_9SPHN|nr:hypothetical protein [Tsuneonella litorea]MCT2559046.1 hypothetical protein [Tsuneonella litorea]
MNLPIALLAPLALLVPSVGGWLDDGPRDQLLPPPDKPQVAPREPIATLDFVDGATVRQVRIEQRVTIRIAPRDPAVRPSMLARIAPDASEPARFAERKMGKCVPVSGIAAVEPDTGGRLLLFMRDQRLVSASLEKACSARDFYSGFYLERTGDGLLCVDRDKLHSRAGASCGISRMRQLVAADD